MFGSEYPFMMLFISSKVNLLIQGKLLYYLFFFFFFFFFFLFCFLFLFLVLFFVVLFILSILLIFIYFIFIYRVRHVSVLSLDSLSDEDFVLYLPQLLQVFKYELFCW